MEDELFTESVRDKLLNVDRANIVNRLKEGKPLTEQQRARLLGISQRFAKTQVELADILNVDRKTIQRWRKQDGFPEPKADGRWDVVAVREWREQNRSTDDANAEDYSKEEGEARRVWLQVEKLEHELEVSKGNWLSAEEVTNEIRRLVGLARGILLGIPDKLAPVVIGQSEAEASERMKEEIDHALSQISQGAN